MAYAAVYPYILLNRGTLSLSICGAFDCVQPAKKKAGKVVARPACVVEYPQPATWILSGVVTVSKNVAAAE